MRRSVVGCGIVLCWGMLFAAGCAKEEVVKKDADLVAKEEAAASGAKSTPGTAATTPETAVRQPAPTTPPPAATTPPATETAPAPREEAEGAAGKKAGTEVEPPARAEAELQKVYFDFDSAALSDTARSALKKNYELLKGKSGAKVEIEGHCDERGSDEYNLALGERRAKAARNYLVNLGINGDRLSTISYGKERPADPGHDEEAWAKNRRDEFIVTK